MMSFEDCLISEEAHACLKMGHGKVSRCHVGGSQGGVMHESTISMDVTLAMTMSAFSATMLLDIQLKEKNWTASLTYAAAIFPFSIFGMMQFPFNLAVSKLG